MRSFEKTRVLHEQSLQAEGMEVPTLTDEDRRSLEAVRHKIYVLETLVNRMEVGVPVPAHMHHILLLALTCHGCVWWQTNRRERLAQAGAEAKFQKQLAEEKAKAELALEQERARHKRESEAAAAKHAREKESREKESAEAVAAAKERAASEVTDMLKDQVLSAHASACCTVAWIPLPGCPEILQKFCWRRSCSR